MKNMQRWVLLPYGFDCSEPDLINWQRRMPGNITNEVLSQTQTKGLLFTKVFCVGVYFESMFQRRAGEMPHKFTPQSLVRVISFFFR